MKFSSVEITWMIHATEDGEKVVKKMVELLLLNNDDIKYSKLEGHFGNPILLYKVRLTGDEADKFVSTLFSSLRDIGKKVLESELSEHLDEHGDFYIRIDKQLLCEGKIGFTGKDAIRMKLKSKSDSKLHDKLSYYRGLLK
jgi:RNA binding exosome subunit